MAFVYISLYYTLSILAIGGIIYIITNMKKENQKTNFRISSQALLQIYLYLISSITLGILVIGIGLTSKAILSYKVSIPFSYSLSKANDKEEIIKYEGAVGEDFKECYQGEVMELYGGRYCFDEAERENELIVGISLTLSMLILFAIHQFAISKVKKEKRIPIIKNIYTFLSLLLYSVIGLITIPLSIYLLTTYFLVKPDLTSYYTPPGPAMACTLMLLSIPLWIYFLRKTVPLKGKEFTD